MSYHVAEATSALPKQGCLLSAQLHRHREGSEEELWLHQAASIPVCDTVLHPWSWCKSVQSTLQAQPWGFWQEEADLAILLAHHIFNVAV